MSQKILDNYLEELKEIQEAERKCIASAECLFAGDNYKLFECFLRFVPEPGTYKQFSDNIHMDFTLEHCQNYGSIYDTFLVMFSTLDNMDIIKEPMIKFVLDKDRKVIIPTYYENSILQLCFHIFDYDYTGYHPAELFFADSALHNLLLSAAEAYGITTLDHHLTRKDDIEYVRKNQLEAFYVWHVDCGHSINAIPSESIPDINENSNIEREFLCPFPLDYVKEKGFERYGKYIVCKGRIDKELGLIIENDEKDYERWY
jgi:hypothetical protein